MSALLNHKIISAFNYYKPNATSSYYSCLTPYFWSRDLIIAHHFNTLLLCLSLLRGGEGGVIAYYWRKNVIEIFTIWRNQQFVWKSYVMKRTGSMVKK